VSSVKADVTFSAFILSCSCFSPNHYRFKSVLERVVVDLEIEEEYYQNGFFVWGCALT